MKNTNPNYAIPFYQLKKTASAHTLYFIFVSFLSQPRLIDSTRSRPLFLCVQRYLWRLRYHRPTSILCSYCCRSFCPHQGRLIAINTIDDRILLIQFYGACTNCTRSCNLARRWPCRWSCIGWWQLCRRVGNVSFHGEIDMLKLFASINGLIIIDGCRR